MTIYDEVKGYMERSPKSRERANKNRFLAWLLSSKHPNSVTPELMEILITEGSSYDRAWRQVLQHEPHLRGKDYDDKVMVEQEKELELGYVPGHTQDQKKLKTL